MESPTCSLPHWLAFTPISSCRRPTRRRRHLWPTRRPSRHAGAHPGHARISRQACLRYRARRPLRQPRCRRARRYRLHHRRARWLAHRRHGQLRQPRRMGPGSRRAARRRPPRIVVECRLRRWRPAPVRRVVVVVVPARGQSVPGQPGPAARSPSPCRRTGEGPSEVLQTPDMPSRYLSGFVVPQQALRPDGTPAPQP